MCGVTLVTLDDPLCRGHACGRFNLRSGGGYSPIAHHFLSVKSDL
jgi:hypothetical protein